MGWSRSMRKERGAGGGAVAGCMSGVLQLFDFRQEAVTVDATTQSSHESAARPEPENGLCPRGIEAPRNSLEILPTVKRVPVEQQQRRQDEEDEEIPMAFEIFTRPMTSKDSISPNPKCKSPSVVARLMGIEILPDEVENEAGGGGGGCGGGVEGKDSSGVNSSAKDCTSSVKKLSHPREMKLKELNRELRILEKRCENIIRQDRVLALSRSLPESPRISLSRRSDAEHRLSLQIQKENVPPFSNIGYAADGIPLASSPSSSTSSFSLRNLDTKRASFGSNAGRSTSPRLVLSSNSPRLAKTAKEENKHSSTSPCSPRLRLRGQEECTNKVRARPENQTATSSPKNNSQKVTRLCTTPVQASEPKPRGTKSGPRLGPSAKGKPRFEVSAVKTNNGGLARTPRKERSPPKIRESYVRVLDIKSGTPKKRQKPICDNLLKAHSVIPTTKASSAILLRTPVSGVAPPPQSSRTSSAAAVDGVDHDSVLPKRPRLNSLCSSSSLPISIHDTIPSSSSSLVSSSAPTGEKGSVAKDTFFVYEYIKAILELMGVRSNTKVSFIHWYSPSHPLDPAVFIKLDAYHHGRPSHGGGGHHHGMITTMPNTRSSRRLVFQLVDEVLREKLRPRLVMRPWMMTGQGACTTGKQLLDEVWTETRGFPSADCRILQDIDGLVANDVNSGHFSSPINDADAESVAESILFRIGQDIADSLVGETVVDLLSF